LSSNPALWCLAALSVVACAERPLSSKAQPIFGGVPDTIATHQAVVALNSFDYLAFCSGTYVGQRTVVTAGHCFEGGPPPSFIYFGPDSDADGARCFNNPRDAVSCPRFIPVLSFDDPGFQDEGELRNDLAVLKLAYEPVIDGLVVPPFPFVRFSDETNLSESDEGALVSFAGYGQTEDDTFGAKLVVSNIPLVAVGPDPNIPAQIDDNQVFYEQPPALGGPCSGDSGGPMFIERSGVELLAAVTSFGDTGCVDFGVSTRVDRFEGFIEGFCGEAGCGAGDCGDGLVNNGEACDGADLEGQSCQSLGFAGGALACHESCAFNFAGCAASPGVELCINNVDEDNDGDVDCFDSDCQDNPLCEVIPLRFLPEGRCAVQAPGGSDRGLCLAFGGFLLGLLASRRKAQRR
jgi:Trypsin